VKGLPVYLNYEGTGSAEVTDEKVTIVIESKEFSQALLRLARMDRLAGISVGPKRKPVKRRIEN
jgi:hypothetical protein